MYTIDDELREFIQSGVAVVVGTADDRGRPQLTYGWGPRVRDDRTSLSLFLDIGRADATLENLRTTGKIAVTFASPISYRSVQLKGTFLGMSDATAADRDWVQQHRDAFMTAAALVGDPMRGSSRNRWMEDVLRIDFTVEQAFNQTPGPSAGDAL